ncbi:DUF692 domain-containing protein [bacterium]|nr:DUF692 domain-containing protein [bacterium]
MAIFSWGLGLRPAHFADWHVADQVPVLELMADNLLHHSGGPALWHTSQIVRRAPWVVLHGIGLNIGGKDSLSKEYLSGLRDLCERFRPRVVSDHLCFTQSEGLQSYELLPVVRTKAMLEHIVQRIDQVQQYLGRRYTLENVSAYVEYMADDIPEGEFLSEIARLSGCGILLDVNNVYVSARNFGLDPLAELNRYNLDAVTQIHIAGHSIKDDFLFDTHDAPVCPEVWELLETVLKKFASEETEKGPTESDIAVILENDDAETALPTLLEQLNVGRRS